MFHDENTYNRTGFDCRICDLSFNELQQLNAAFFLKKENFYTYREKPIRIPTLRSVFEKFPNAKFVLDVHTENEYAIFKIIKLIEEFNKEKDVIIVSKYDSVISFFKQNKEKLVYGAATKEAKKFLLSCFLMLDFLYPLNSNIIFIPVMFNKTKLLTKRLLKQLKKNNKKIIVWQFEGKTNDEVVCVETKKEYLKYKEMGIDGIYTENPFLFNEIIS